MSNNRYYKIEDTEALAKIHAFFEKRDAFYKRVTEMCEKYGFKYHSTTDSIVFGIRFNAMGFDPKETEIDKSLWKTSKVKNSHIVNVLPRSTAKDLKKEYDELKPQDMGYSELTKIILAGDYDLWSKSYGYSYKKGEYFKFETSLQVSPIAIEILGSEYLKEIGGE